MFTFFPGIYNDELLFSIYARYHARSLNKNERKTINEMGLASMNPLIPKKMNYYIEKMKYFRVPDADYFLKEHTIYGFYINFLSAFQQRYLYDYMIHGKSELGSDIKYLIIQNTRYLKYCPECMVNDLAELGEIYWRLHHQFPTVIICRIHYNLLEQSKIHITDTSFETVLKTIFIKETQKRRLSRKSLFHAGNFAQQSLYLSKNDISFYDKTRAQDFYLRFIEKGFVNELGKIDIPKLKKEIIQYFGVEFLQIINFSLDIFEEIEKNPLGFLYNSGPVEKLVLINFLFGSLTPMINYQYRLPNGEVSPFECLNPFCEFYKKNIINFIRIHLLEEYGKVKIYFRCGECKIEYEKIFKTNDWSVEETKIHYNEEWNTNLIKLVYQEGLDINKLSLKTNLTTLEIERILMGKNSYGNIDNTMVIQNRVKWTKLINITRNMPIAEIKLMNFPLYAFLKRNDEKWLYSSGYLISSTQVPNSINCDLWRKRDKKVLLYLKSIVSAGITKGYVKVNYEISNAIHDLDLNVELPYLINTSKYIEKHKLFMNALYNKKILPY